MGINGPAEAGPFPKLLIVGGYLRGFRRGGSALSVVFRRIVLASSPPTFHARWAPAGLVCERETVPRRMSGSRKKQIPRFARNDNRFGGVMTIVWECRSLSRGTNSLPLSKPHTLVPVRSVPGPGRFNPWRV